MNAEEEQPLRHVSTFVAGEGSRLLRAARELGLQQSRTTTGNVRAAVSKLFTESTALHMHSVGILGENERLDATGTLHYVSLRRRKNRRIPEYGALDDLFHQEPVLKEEAIKKTSEEDEEVDVVEGGSLSAAIFGVVKGTVGPAILYLPRGFQQSGWAVAVPSILFATYMFIYNACRLLECWKVESDKNHTMASHIESAMKRLGETETSTFTPTLLTYPELARRSLGRYAFLVDFGIASMQFGVCLSYLIFVPQNLQECVLYLSGCIVPKRLFLLMMLMIEVPLTWITDIRRLAPTNVTATLLTAFGLCAVLGMAFHGAFRRDHKDALYFVTNLQAAPVITDKWFIFIGTSFFMMEGSMTLVVPLQEAIILKKDRDLFPRTNAVVTSWIVVFYLIFSFICVAGFGSGLRTALTASLQGSVAATVQLAYSLAVILTFPLQAFPAMQVVIMAVLGRGKSLTPSIERCALSTTVVVLLGILAVVALDYLGNVVSILGSIFGIPLALVYPPLMHNLIVKDASVARRTANCCVVAIGFFAMASASYATIVNWNNNSEAGDSG